MRLKCETNVGIVFVFVLSSILYLFAVIANVAVLENYLSEQAEVTQEKSPAENIFEVMNNNH